MDDDVETRILQQKESVYRKFYSALLRKHREVLQEKRQQHQASTEGAPDDFAEEQQVLNRIFQTEVQNLVLGVGATAVCFALLRTAKASAMPVIFGNAKARAILEANIKAKQIGTEGIQNRVGTTATLDGYTPLVLKHDIIVFRLPTISLLHLMQHS
jgi:hypothetical protein